MENSGSSFIGGASYLIIICLNRRKCTAACGLASAWRHANATPQTAMTLFLFRNDFTHVDIAEPERRAVHLQLDRALGRDLTLQENGVVHDDGAVENDGDLCADHLDVHAVPFADFLVLDD